MMLGLNVPWQTERGKMPEETVIAMALGMILIKNVLKQK